MPCLETVQLLELKVKLLNEQVASLAAYIRSYREASTRIANNADEQSSYWEVKSHAMELLRDVHLNPPTAYIRLPVICPTLGSKCKGCPDCCGIGWDEIKQYAKSVEVGEPCSHM